MIGTLNKDELNGLEFIVEDAKNKIIPVPFEKELLAFRTDSIKSNVTVNPEVIDAMEILIDIKLDGGIVETFNQRDYFKEATLRDAEAAVSKEVENLIQKAIDKGQKELQTDIFKIWRILERKHYGVWEQVKNNWDRGENYFSNATFTVRVDTEIHSTGSTNKSDESRR